jgi:hypothetical protein
MPGMTYSLNRRPWAATSNGVGGMGGSFPEGFLLPVWYTIWPLCPLPLQNADARPTNGHHVARSSPL